MDRSQVRNPGRPREFDPDEALARATSAFWSHGYANTTFRALEEATGIHAQSLRYVFGDKRSLFLAVLRHYARSRVGRIARILRQRKPTALAAIHEALEIWLEDARREVDKGCLMVNTTGEFGRQDSEIARVIDEADRRLVNAFAGALAAAQAAGEICPGADSKELARMIVTLGDGAMLHSRAQGSAKVAEKAFGALASLLTHRRY